MLFSRFSPAAWAALLASTARGSPMPLDLPLGRPQTDLAVRGAMDMADHHLEKRLSADFSLDHSWDNEVLFSGSWGNNGSSDSEFVSLSVVCLECYTKGTVTAKLTDEEIVNPVVRLEFDGVEAYVDLGIVTNAGATYTVNLFTSNSPIGLGFPGLDVGVVFYVDLVFTLTAEVDLEAGFYVQLADGSYLEASLFGGDITDQLFDGISSKSLPVTVTTGRATFKADLRLRVDCGAEAEIAGIGIGAGAELSVYLNILEFVAILETTSTCELQTREYFDINAGAIAELDVVIDYTTIGAVPTVSTTLYAAPTLTQCWDSLLEGSSATLTTTATMITPAAYSEAASVPLVSGDDSVSIATTLSFGGASYKETTSTLTTAYIPAITTAPSVSAGIFAPSSSFKYPLSNSSIPTAGSGTAAASGSGEDELVTSTVYATTVYTVTSCAATVVNCPASLQQEVVVTKTVEAFTTVCPATATISAPTSSSSAASTGSGVVVHVVTDVVVLVPCSSPIVETYVPPSTAVTPAAQKVTATALAVAAISSTTTSTSTSTKAAAAAASSSWAIPVGEGEKLKWSNGTASASYSPVTYGTGKPSASLAQTTTAALAVPGTTTAVTAGAGRSLVGLSSLVGVALAALVLF
ncbi:hypothetical protein NKR23_g2213 [Pleurostoma richardsiae]|uniref:Uncharacterized protein n=1 Tax=Pleurostoma richardsiae TaxID=41990 RepID=A0AA38S2N6_9PEZI|nr:hypothetical protein NKR23_g2213 [Pleurostoma richardsiae]